MKGLLIFVLLATACMAAPSDNMIEFLKGFLEGINESGDINNLIKCLKTGDDFLRKVKEAVELIKKMDPINVLKGVQELLGAVKELIEALKPCMDGFEELKKLMNALTHFDIRKIVQKIIGHASEFLMDITGAIECFSKGNYRCAGKFVGDILRRLFLTNGSDYPLVDFVAGFLVGIQEKKTIEDVMKCMKESDQIIEKVIQALKLIVTLKIDNLLKGFGLLFEALLELEMMLKPCLDGFIQFNKLIEEMKNADFMKLILKILRDPLPFVSDVTDCIEAFSKGNYTEAGKDIGDILYRLFLVPSATLESTLDTILLLATGFLEGLNQGGSFNNVQSCVNSVPLIVGEVEKIVATFKAINWSDFDKVIDAFVQCLLAIKDTLQSLKPCRNSPAELNAFLQKIINIDANELLNKIIKNALQIISDITNAIKGLKNQLYEQCGKVLGDVIYQLILTTE